MLIKPNEEFKSKNFRKPEEIIIWVNLNKRKINLLSISHSEPFSKSLYIVWYKEKK